MAAIKAKQWDIDRAYNMSLANAERTIKLLSCIDEIEQGILSKEEGLSCFFGSYYYTRSL